MRAGRRHARRSRVVAARRRGRGGRAAPARAGRTRAGHPSTGATRATSPPSRPIPSAWSRPTCAAAAATLPAIVQGPMMKAPVWTWEVPLYFWFGGMAAGASFVGARLRPRRRRALGARRAQGRARPRSLPSPPLLIMDLGRPERFYNMLRIFKPRSPMSMGAWCLTVFGSLARGVGRRRPARAPPDGAGPRRGQRRRRRLPRVLHRRAARLDRGPGVGAQPAVPRPDLRLDRDAHRRRHDAPGAVGDRPAGRPPDARGARPGRERRDGAPSCCSPRSTSTTWADLGLRAGRGRRRGLVSPRPVAGPGRSARRACCATARAGPLEHVASVAFLAPRCASASPGWTRGGPPPRTTRPSPAWPAGEPPARSPTSTSPSWSITDGARRRPRRGPGPEDAPVVGPAARDALASRCSRKAWADLRDGAQRVADLGQRSPSPRSRSERDDPLADLGDELGVRVEPAADADGAAVGAQRRSASASASSSDAA